MHRGAGPHAFVGAPISVPPRPHWRQLGHGGRHEEPPSVFDTQPRGCPLAPVQLCYGAVRRGAADTVQRHRHRHPHPPHLLCIIAHWAAEATSPVPVWPPLPSCCSIGEGSAAGGARPRAAPGAERVAVLLLSGVPAASQNVVLPRRVQLLVACHEGAAAGRGEALYSEAVPAAEGASQAGCVAAVRRICRDQLGVDISELPDSGITPFADFVYRQRGVESRTRVMLARVWQLPDPVTALKLVEEVEEEVEVIEVVDLDEEDAAAAAPAEPAAKRPRKRSPRQTRKQTHSVLQLRPRLVMLHDLTAPHTLASAADTEAFELLATADMTQELLQRECAGGALGALLEARRLKVALEEARKAKEVQMHQLSRQRAKERLASVRKDSANAAAAQKAFADEWDRKEKAAEAEHDARIAAACPGPPAPSPAKLLYFGMFDRGNSQLLSMVLCRARFELALGALGTVTAADVADLCKQMPAAGGSPDGLSYKEVAVQWTAADPASPAGSAAVINDADKDGDDGSTDDF
eukprot:TRINITY_DN50534_c0_g1_i1.p2 TRINITY_DN50534_c0_g1~~TRINITY_DN50534_c0_g1_i1.p2  ORF type:complete len:522 (+),score=191.22 TRINITY_DN50534_c0_g1_i1:108-1673(+)